MFKTPADWLIRQHVVGGRGTIRPSPCGSAMLSQAVLTTSRGTASVSMVQWGGGPLVLRPIRWTLPDRVTDELLKCCLFLITGDGNKRENETSPPR